VETTPSADRGDASNDVAQPIGDLSFSRFMQAARAMDTGQTGGETSWSAVDLGPYLRGEQVMEPPQFLARSDGKRLIYAGKPHTFYGPSESLKTWAAILAARSFLEEGLTVIYLDFEGNEMSFVERCRFVGIKDGYIGHALAYVRPVTPLLRRPKFSKDEVEWVPEAIFDLGALEFELRPALVIIDGVSEVYALHGWNINAAEDAAHFQALFRGFSDATASIAIDHTSKDAGRGVIGSQHKRAGLDGAEYEFEPVIREGRGGHSVATIRVTKDRHGYVREFAPHGTIGDIHVDAEGARIEAPDMFTALSAADRLDQSILGAIREAPGMSSKAVTRAVGGRAESTYTALKRLEIDGLIRNEGSKSRSAWFLVDRP
jgi:hypothetical protein